MGKAKIDLDLLSLYLKQGKTQAQCSRLFNVSEAAVSKARRKLEAIVPAREPPQAVEASQPLKDPVPPRPEPEPKPHRLYRTLDALDSRLVDNSKMKSEMGFFDDDSKKPSGGRWGWMKE